MKLEAEGAEPEALDGLGDARPAKLAIDASAERNGRSTVEMCRSRLHAMDYETRVEREVVFARL